jgi:hypothetical protein
MPFRQFEIPTTASHIDVERRIAAIVRPKRKFAEYFKRSSGDKPFEGEVGRGGFRIRRVIKGQNSFLPQIRGDIQSSAAGTVVRVRMTIHPLSVVMILMWAALVAKRLSSSGRPVGAVFDADWIPFAMVAFAVVLVVACFYPEARKAERLIREAVNTAG